MKIYFCGNALAKQINITSESSSFGHKKYTFEKEVFLWPEHFNKTSISPQTFLAHKKKQGIEKLIIIDRIKTPEGIIKIKGHINRSGILEGTFFPRSHSFRIKFLERGKKAFHRIH